MNFIEMGISMGDIIEVLSTESKYMIKTKVLTPPHSFNHEIRMTVINPMIRGWCDEVFEVSFNGRLWEIIKS